MLVTVLADLNHPRRFLVYVYIKPPPVRLCINHVFKHGLNLFLGTSNILVGNDIKFGYVNLIFLYDGQHFKLI